MQASGHNSAVPGVPHNKNRGVKSFLDRVGLCFFSASARTIIEVDRLNQDDIVEVEGTFYAPVKK